MQLTYMKLWSPNGVSFSVASSSVLLTRGKPSFNSDRGRRPEGGLPGVFQRQSRFGRHDTRVKV